MAFALNDERPVNQRLGARRRPVAGEYTLNVDELTDEQLNDAMKQNDPRIFDEPTRIKIAKRLGRPLFEARTVPELLGDAVETSNAQDILFGSEDDIEEELI